jgi:probable addiction module antidote protein
MSQLKAVIFGAIGVIARARGIAHVSRETGLGREAVYKATSPDGDPARDGAKALDGGCAGVSFNVCFR